MSDYYTESPASRLFSGGSSLLAGGRFQDPETRKWTFTEVTLYVDFLMYDRGVELNIFNSETHEDELKTVRFRDIASLEEKLSDISSKYPGKVKVKPIMDKARIYFAGIEDAVCIDGKVTDDESSCEQCGDYNVDIYEFQFFPAVFGSVLKDASIDLHWQFGCYGGKALHGTFEDNGQEALDMLMHMLELASDEYKADIQQAIDTVREHLETP